jgi:hypothetical protein
LLPLVASVLVSERMPDWIYRGVCGGDDVGNVFKHNVV